MVTAYYFVYLETNTFLLAFYLQYGCAPGFLAIKLLAFLVVFALKGHHNCPERYFLHFLFSPILCSLL